MGFLNPPDAPSASQMTQAQTQANANQIGQSQAAAGNAFGPFSNTTQSFGAVDPATGIRRLNTSTSLSPENQLLWQQLAGNRAGIGGGIGNLIGNYYNQLSTAPDLSTTAGSLTDQMLQRHLGYMEPYFNFEQNSLENRLRNQGASDNAYNYANMQASDNRARNVMQAINQFEPMAFSQALQSYQAPINTIQSLMGLIGPYFGTQAGPSSFQAGSVNAAENMQKAYQNELQQYQNMIQGLFGMGSAVLGMPLGTAAGAVPTVGSKIGSSIGGLFT